MVDSWGNGRPDYRNITSGINFQVDISGDPVTISGDYVNITSGINLQVDISGDPVTVSGQPVTISGGHVFVESGVHVVADIAESGIGVQIQSGAGVLISGQATTIGAVYKTHTDEWSGFIGSGDIVVVSGIDVSIYQKVGLYIQASGSMVINIQASYDDTSGNYCDYNGYDPVVSGLTGCKRFSLGDYPFEYVRAKVENMGASGCLNIRWARAT